MTYRPWITEFTEYIAPDGVIYKFDGSDRFLISEDGLGMPDIQYITEHGPYQHGSTPIDFRLQPRVIQMIHRRQTCGRGDYWDSRSELLNAIRPNRQLAYCFQPGILRKRLPYGAIRDIKVFIDKGPLFAPRDTTQWDEWGYTETLRFIAHDPLFYGSTLHNVLIPNTFSDQLQFPITFPIGFGSNFIANTVTLTYAGDWLCYPTIVIQGPISGPRIINYSIGLDIWLNYVIGADETVTITLGYDNKTVYNNFGISLLDTVKSPGNLAAFHLAPDPEAPGGVNVLGVMGQSAYSGGLYSIYVQYYDTYIGM